MFIPDHFQKVPYNSEINPDNPPYDFLDLSQGSNCLIFTYAILKANNFDPPIFWSTELWEDKSYTTEVDEYREFDIIFYGNNRLDTYWWHTVLYLGNSQVMHLSKEVGFPEIVDYRELVERGSYRYMLGAKRLILL